MAQKQQSITCPQCGASFHPDALEMLCPRCVVRMLSAAAALPGVDSAGPEREPAIAGRLPDAKARVKYFGDYELLEEIGRGGMGVVYRAKQLSLNRVVAVKMLLHGEFAGDQFVQRFHAEAEAAASLQHPNIVAIHEVGVHEGHHYFSMDYVEGRNLQQVAAESPVPLATAVRYVRQIAEAINYAHQRGIVHRDLKPSNVLIDEFDQPRITDFGLAKRLSGGADLTVSGQVLGAPNYMPPEQAAGKHSRVGIASDVYALGAILFQLLTGRPPFQSESIAETLVKVQTEDPIRPTVLNPATPRDLEAICLKCLKKDARHRYASAALLAEDLRNWQSGKAISVRAPGLTEQMLRHAQTHPVATGIAVFALMGLLGAILLAPKPPKLRIPAGVGELILISEASTASLYLTDDRCSFWLELPMKGVHADISPDGRRLCFARKEGANSGGVWVSDLNGARAKCLVHDALEPRWLDSQSITYKPTNHLSVLVVNTTTGQKRKLFDFEAIAPRGHAGEVKVSPDGKRLLVNPQNGRLGHRSDVYICNFEGKHVSTVWEDHEDFNDIESGTADHQMFWLDNETVIWTRHARESNRVSDMAIVCCRLGQTNLQALTNWKGYNYALAVSPDGKRILYLTEDTPGFGRGELWTMNRDGTDKRKLTDREFGLEFTTAGCWFRRAE